MPLGFQSLNRGTIAFGFFNIDTDMILLNHYFMFAETFCQLVSELASREKVEDFQTQFEAYIIERPQDVGDLAGAIHGAHHEGFIGAVYQHFPFPKTPTEFCQRPDGTENRAIVKKIISSYAVKKKLPFFFEGEAFRVALGDIQFDRKSFGELVRYICDGGAPGWKNNLRPLYVSEMMKAIARSENPFFKG